MTRGITFVFLGMLCACGGRAAELNAERRPTPDRFSIAAGGDVMLGRVGDDGFRSVADAESLIGIGSVFADAQIGLVNLESSVCPDLVDADGERVILCAPPASVAAFDIDGIDVVSIANNHIGDGGEDGAHALLSELAERGIEVAGATGDAPTVVGVDPPVAIFAATTTPPFGDARTFPLDVPVLPTDRLADTLCPRIAETLAERLDAIVVVSLHWGTEDAPEPTREQVDAAHALVGCGAHLIVGHGPHVLQRADRLGSSAVLYSLGDLRFDNEMPGRQRSAIATVSFERGELGWAVDTIAWTGVDVGGAQREPTVLSQ